MLAEFLGLCPNINYFWPKLQKKSTESALEN
ncbi:hypothetical protein SGRA_2692 [Saprospira grandis str. Lewin]|uniref:Uncharacterized protein n=1 Tax=Saprospira grandis (strain Lewin) TaxID=984262 RepID=H6L9E4_SAPGL|nr:hypothetical protein SGRA_2692 [Saprospira grandis str. Lewin]